MDKRVRKRKVWSVRSHDSWRGSIRFVMIVQGIISSESTSQIQSSHTKRSVGDCN